MSCGVLHRVTTRVVYELWVLHRVTTRVVYELWGVTQSDYKSGV